MSAKRGQIGRYLTSGCPSARTRSRQARPAVWVSTDLPAVGSRQARPAGDGSCQAEPYPGLGRRAKERGCSCPGLVGVGGIVGPTGNAALGSECRRSSAWARQERPRAADTGCPGRGTRRPIGRRDPGVRRYDELSRCVSQLRPPSDVQLSPYAWWTRKIGCSTWAPEPLRICQRQVSVSHIAYSGLTSFTLSNSGLPTAWAISYFSFFSPYVPAMPQQVVLGLDRLDARNQLQDSRPGWPMPWLFNWHGAWYTGGEFDRLEAGGQLAAS